MTQFNIHGICTKVYGSAEDYFSAELGWFKSDKCSEPIIKIVEGNVENYPFFELFSQRESKSFLHVPFGDIGDSSITLTYEQGLNPAYLFYIFEAILHFVLLSRGKALVHGASFALHGKGVWVTSWGGTGKTNLLLYFLTNNSNFKNFSYLSDDWTIVDRSGMLMTYPKRMRIYGYNIAAYPQFSPGRKLLPLYKTFRFLYNVSPSRLLRIAITKFEPKVVIPPWSLPKVEILEKAKPDLVIFMRKYSNVRKPSLNNIGFEEIVKGVVACVKYERNYFFKEYYKYVHYTGKTVEVIEKHDERLSEILISLLENAGKTVEIQVPLHVGPYEAEEIAALINSLLQKP